MGISRFNLLLATRRSHCPGNRLLPLREADATGKEEEKEGEGERERAHTQSAIQNLQGTSGAWERVC